MKPSIRILLTGAGSPAAFGVIKSLRLSDAYHFEFVCMDSSPNASGFYLADRIVVGPKATDEAFVPFILQICENEKIDLIFSLVTGELIKLASIQDKLAEIGTSILISSVAALTDAIHKGKLYARLRKSGIETPKFYVVHTPAELIEAIHALGYPQQPVCFKPTVTDGSRGFHIIDRSVDRRRLLFYEKPNSAFISISELHDVICREKTLPELIVMEYLPHEEYSVDVLADEGNVIVAVPRLREAT
ncbi:MAG TPA: ATP-grasp domain-containing protein, partial [Bacilli bacterium]